jgi:O-antigen/teichoic acid export membrane protein
MADVSTGMCGAVLDMTGHTTLKLINAVVRFVLSLGLSILLIPQWGVVGAAIAALAAVGGVNLLRLVQVFVLFRLLPYDWSSLKPLLAGAAALGVVLLLGRGETGDVSLAAVAIRASVLMVVYVGMILALGLSPEDRAVLAAVRKRLGGRKEQKT